MKIISFTKPIQIVTIVILLFCMCIKASAQSPYAVFGDNSVMLNTKKESAKNIYRVHILENDKVKYLADFDFGKGAVILSDLNGNVILHDSISENAKAVFTSIDPHAEKYYSISPYSYCGGNPINAIDPDGRSTWVINAGNGTYQVIGGNLEDKDRNVYVYSQDKNGKYTIRGNSIGQTTSMTSFYNSDKKSWAKDAIIDLSDNSGKGFLNRMVSSDVTLDDYMSNARTGKPYDFKVTNGTNKVIPKIDIYRGMSIGSTANGQQLISSARDIGNMAAGIVAAKNGISWSAARIAFDAYQSKCSGRPVVEGISTRNAEYYGWSMMHRYSNTHSEAKNVWNSIFDFFDNLF
ncbi:hypothetical protein [Segatella bryantii]|uniref:hypothetical protein n=1 Tax=Segatella bryantii TaxID=77095 RepID=UPI002853149F|nr:hypothetical protein [Segatella bryantii]MDR4932139.1 hypothetical protein [Segatella bryantii]